MAKNFLEAVKNLEVKNKNKTIKKIKLINGDIVEGDILAVKFDMIELKRPDQGAGQAIYTIPFTSILIISDSALA